MTNKKNNVDVYDIWDKFQKSKTYMETKGIFTKTERCWNFYIGKQWESLKDSQGLEDLPMLNFIKQTVKYKVSTIAQHSVSAVFSDLKAENKDLCERLGKLFDISWDKAKMDRQAWKILRDAGVQGDGYAYWYSGDTRKTPQIVHNTQMHLGDENITDIQDQPWLIIEERAEASFIRERAKLQGCSAEEIELIMPDGDSDKSLLNKKEVSNKVTSLIYMQKVDGIVHVARATKHVEYEKFHPISQMKGNQPYGEALTKYPIVPMIWEETPNNARGTSEVEQLIANQVELNKTLARRAISIKQTAFPRLAVDDTSLLNPEDLDKVGAVIKLNGGNAQSIANMIAYLSPMSQSPDAANLSEELLQKTKDLHGASDTALGNIDLSRVSGTAATTIRDQQQVPLNEQVAMYQEFVENVALMYFELWKVYFPDGIEMDGVEVSAEEIASIEPNVRIDIAENTTLSRMATQQELTNLFNNNKITFSEYAKAYPEHASIDKQVLIEIDAERQAQAQQQMMQQQMMQQQMMGGDPMIDNEMPPEIPPQDVSQGGGASYQDIQSQLAQG